MILFPPEAEMETPGMCFICEQTPDRKNVPVAATQRIFRPDMNTYLNGMKYLCGECVETAMIVFGWPLVNESRGWEEAVEQLLAERDELLQRLDTYATLDEHIRSIGKEKPIRKPKATKPEPDAGAE